MKIRIIIALFLFLGVLMKAIGQDLNTYIAEALENNPAIHVVALKNEKEKEKVNEASTFPNTQFGAGYFVSEPETRTGTQTFRLSAKQMFPWFGMTTARENYANSLVEVGYEDIAIAKKRLVMLLTQSYYDLYAIKAKQKVLDENIQLLKTHEALALTSVKTGNTSVVDILRLQIRQNELDEKNKILQQEFLTQQAVFNKLLNREGEIPIIIPERLSLPKDDNPINPDLNLHPQLVKYDKMAESIEHFESLNQKERKPQIGLGFDYINVAERPNMEFSDNGKDILMPSITVSVPIFSKKYTSKTIQNKLKQQQLLSKQQDQLNALDIMLHKALKMQEVAKISYATSEENLKQAKDAEAILINTYKIGTVDLDVVLDIQELQLKFQTNQIETVKKYYIQQAIIHYVTN